MSKSVVAGRTADQRADGARRDVRLWLAATAFVVSVVVFWAWELFRILDDIDRRIEEKLAAHQAQLLDRKGEELRDLFTSLYQNTRTVALLPMVREVTGGNRRSAGEDVVALGRFSPDAHRTVQQIYSNLQANIQVSELYYVLDGFQPGAGEVPFFMYDEYIAGTRDAAAPAGPTPPDQPPEVEEVEYAYYAKQLDWFRANEPRFRFASRIEEIPAIISPLLRTCDNTQFVSRAQGNEQDTFGFLYSVPVYDRASGLFKGLVSAVVRANVLEARLLGIPFLVITDRDREIAARIGFTVPADVAPFVLREEKHGIEIFDRRQPAFAGGQAAADRLPGRWATRHLDLASDGSWQLAHYLSPLQIAVLSAPLRQERVQAIVSRIALLLLLAGLIAAVYMAQRRRQKDLLWLAQHDPLTELPNRRVFFSRLEEAIGRSAGRGERVALFFVDINQFNAINDLLGHRGGDQMLVGIARRLRDRVRITDEVTRVPADPRFLVSRLGGDEFAVIAEGVASLSDVPTIADRLVMGLREPIRIRDQEVDISASIGVAVFPDDARDAEELLLSADTAMHQCRAEGFGYHLFNEALRKQAEREHLLSLELQSALVREEFELFYQPKMLLADSRVVSFEALLRWRSEKFGMVCPVEFIPLLERSGHIQEVGEWVLRQACCDLARFQQRGWPDGHMSVNVSVRQLRRMSFHDDVARVLASTGTNPQSLILEVTESIAMDNAVDGVDTLRRLKELGVKLAIDDFGTGYSSLTYLSQFPADYLKLDKAFIDRMGSSEKAMHIVSSVIALARGLSLRTIAEGVEDQGQADLLRSLGCEMIQGYLLARPMPLVEAERWLDGMLAGRGAVAPTPVA